MLAVVHSRARLGVEAPPITIEVHLSSGLPSFSIVGMPETAIRESKHRVRSALLSCRWKFPSGRITINLAPADTPKEGSRFDLPIAIGMLCASGQLVLKGNHLDDYEFLGELALTGHIRGVPGALSAVMAMQKNKRWPIIPTENAAEAALTQGAVLAADHLCDIVAHLVGEAALNGNKPAQTNSGAPTTTKLLSDVKGQLLAKRALGIAAAGGHNLLMTGPPGTGKTMLAERLPNLLPPMTAKESLSVHALYSAAGKYAGIMDARPFRAPHHTSSTVALVGGGNIPMPGEISLAHQGVLFLDELPEFNKHSLEALREPLESGRVEIARARYRVQFPAEFQLIAAMNPCPAGRKCDSEEAGCVCSAESRRRYAARISQPLMDRIDLRVMVDRPPPEEILQAISDADPGAEPAENILQQHIIQARNKALARRGHSNQRLAARATMEDCRLQPQDQSLLAHAAKRFELSVRGCHKILRVARTIADLANHDAIVRADLQEALSLRTDTVLF